MRLITSLGTGSYKTTKYVWDGRSEETSCFPQALVKWLRPDSVLVLLTDEAARCDNWKDFQKWLLQEQVEYESKTIPEGRTEQQAWQIFEQVVDSVGEGEEVVIDITHAFRSLPLIFFVVTAFLRVYKKVQVRHVVYGCYIPDQPESPVVDLRLMLDLLDWMEGVRRFQELGDARFIGETLQRTQDEIYRRDPKTEEAKPTALKAAGKQLLELSDGLQALRVREVMKSASKLVNITGTATHEAQMWAKPFALLIDQVGRMAVQLAHDKPDELNFDTLEKQMQTVCALVRYRQFVQALLLQREWLVSYVMWRIERRGGWLDHREREKVEELLSAGAKAARSQQDLDLPDLGKYMGQDEIRVVVQLWSEIGYLRNDFAHCGMRQDPRTPDDLRQKVTEFAQQLKNLLGSAKAQF